MLGIYNLGPNKSRMDLLTERYVNNLAGIGKQSRSTRDLAELRSFSRSESPFRKILTSRSVKRFTNSSGKKVKRVVNTYKVSKLPRSMSNSSITSIYSSDNGKGDYCLR